METVRCASQNLDLRNTPSVFAKAASSANFNVCKNHRIQGVTSRPPSEPALDIDNNLYDDSESQKKDYSNADFVPLIIVVFLIMISNSPCKNIHFYRMLQVLRRLFALFSANLRRIAMKRIGKGIMKELLMHSAKHPKYNTK